MLGAPADVDAIAVAVARRKSAELDDRLAEAGACAAMSRTTASGSRTRRARPCARFPLLDTVAAGDSDAEPLAPADRPLAGVRVLDLTRVLAGPVVRAHARRARRRR